MTATFHPSEALETILKGAALTRDPINGPDGRSYVLEPSDFHLREIKDEDRLPLHINQTLIVDDRASLILYANRFKRDQSILIADYDTLTVNAHLDWHHGNDAETPCATGADKHKVTLKLRPSEEFTRWNNFVKEGFHEQEEFARFLEENACDVHAPDPATLIEISRDFEATSSQTYKTSTRLQNGDRRLAFETDTRSSNYVVIPAQITLKMPFYNGEEPSELVANFRWRGKDGKVIFGLEWHRVEYSRRARFNDIASKTAEATELPLFIGR